MSETEKYERRDIGWLYGVHNIYTLIVTDALRDSSSVGYIRSYEKYYTMR